MHSLYNHYKQLYTPKYILTLLKNNKPLFAKLINPNLYKKALDEFITYGMLIHFPSKYLYKWIGIIMRHTVILQACNKICTIKHHMSLILDLIEVFFNNDYELFSKYKKSLSHKGDYRIRAGWIFRRDSNIYDFDAYNLYLDSHRFFDKVKLPDGSLAFTDYGIPDLEALINQYHDNMTPEELLVLINRLLDVTHYSGDLSSMFIEGGKETLNSISNGSLNN